MKSLFFLAALAFTAIAHADDSGSARTVACDGHTVIDVDGRIGAQTPFSAIFSIQNDEVTLIEGDSLNFSKKYIAHEELMSKEGRLGYASEKGNLFFFKTSGRFEIFKMSVMKSGLKTVKTTGQCKPFSASSVFQ